MLIEVFKLVPFRPRLKATIFVCKSFHGLILEKSLWRSVETDRALVGPTLAYMIQPGGSAPAEPLLPRGSVDGVAINMAYVCLSLSLSLSAPFPRYTTPLTSAAQCTTGDVLAIIKRLQSSQNHALASLSLTSAAQPVLAATLSHLSRGPAAASLARLATLHLGGGCSVGDALRPFVAALPALLHLRLDGERAADAALMRCVGGRLKSLVAPACEVSAATAGQLGTWFQGLETLEVRVRGDSNDTNNDIAGLPFLRAAKLTWCGGDGPRFLAQVLLAAPGLRVLSFTASPARADVDVLCGVPGRGVGSPEMRTVVLDGWAPVRAARVDAVWRCPVLVEAPWLWVDVDMERRRRRRMRRQMRRARRGAGST